MTLYPAPLFPQHLTGPSTVDVGPVRHHLEILSRHGIGYRRAAELAGLTPAVTRRIVCGRSGMLPTRIPRETAAKILSIHPDGIIPSVISSRGTQRRIQALVVAGWSQAKLAQRLGCSLTNFKMILQRNQIRPGTAHEVAALFDQLWNVAPPTDTPFNKAAALRASRHGHANGWVAALAWDDIDLDDAPPTLDEDRPELVPVEAFMSGQLDEDALEQEIFDLHVDWVAVDNACGGIPTHLNYYDRRAAIRRLNAQYLSDRDIAERLHLHSRVVFRTRTELRLPGRHDATGAVVLS